ncbi:hypothetical protein [Methylotenera sp.]|uniref:hypothetical protein n=1 Tax=Methylotenera sp. TaxID=2051956 RepID=UPI00272F8FF0|nr:hypothetical protein [Methylotenera sp.]MDP2072375.1 hypothetical protein [Methylotenera sp.]MDP3005618.1 hypothetical protein [Methylotenera sp.]
MSEPSCFTAADTSDVPAFKKAKISLKPVNGNHQLTITTYDVVTEPIINLNVSFHCETNLNREYVLLLDPAPLISVEKPEIIEAASGTTLTNNAVNKTKGQANPSASAQYQAQEENQITPEKVVVKKRTKKKISSIATDIDEKLSESYTGKQNTNGSNPSSIPSDNKAIKTLADRPFLIISGGAANSNEHGNKPNLSLRLATEIDFSRSEATIAPQTTTDAMDEVTVMANRLAHLEKQITSLQTRNAQLVLDAEKTKAKNAKTDWLLMLKIALGIILALATAELLRRKLSNKQENNSDPWFDAKRFDAEEPASMSNDTKLFSSNSKNSLESSGDGASPLSESSYSVTSSQSSSFSNKESITQEKEDHGSVIDDADVFIEHGRPALAIQLLQNHLLDSPSESPAIWLKLINLLSKEASEAEYDEAVLECNKHFNIKAAKYGGTTEKDDSSIEDYPHIITRLEGVWGSPYAVGFINDLINNKRSQPREGLNQGAFEDLFFLKNIATHLDYSNPSTYKTSPDRVAVPNPSLDNATFNDALFTDIELNEVKNSPEKVPSELAFDSKVPNAIAATNQPLAEKAKFDTGSFNIETEPYPDESSYEVNMLPNDDEFSTVDTVSELYNIQHNKAVQSDDSFKVQEIDFTIPVEKVEYATTKKATDKNIELEFSLDFPNENISIEAIPKDSLPKDKSKNKTKAKSSNQKAPESNEIEWDLPEINPKQE